MRAAIPLLLFMAGMQGWVISLPLFGPILFPLAAGVGEDPVHTATLFLNSYAFSFVLWGLILHRIKRDERWLLPLLYISISLCLLLHLALIWTDSRVWSFIFIAIGLLASLPSLGWIHLLKRMVPGQRLGFAFGVNGILVAGFQYAFKAFHGPVLLGMALAAGMLLLALAMLPWIQRLEPIHHPSRVHAQERLSNAVPLLIFIFVIFLLGGVMYQVINPFLLKFPVIPRYFDKLIYILAMPVVGWLIDRKGFRSVVYGMGSLGLAYSLFAFSSAFGAAILGSTLLQIGFAFLDVFVLYALSTWTGLQRPFLILGAGLGVYIFSIRAGLVLDEMIVPASLGNYKLTCLFALSILLVAYLLVYWLGDHEPREMEKKRLMKELTAYFNEKDEELRLAAKIQHQMLPNPQQLPNGMEAAPYLMASREVGGDFYDMIPLDRHRVLFVIGDVTDKGLPAALIMSKVIGLIRSEAYHNHALPEIIKQLNRVLYTDNASFMLVTLGLALVDTEKGTLTYASAGHVSPYLIRDHGLEPIRSSSFPIGVDSDIEPFVAQIPIRPQDILVLYTDGIVEAQSAEQQLYGFDRLEQQLSRAASLKLAPQEIRSLILSDVRLFTGNGTARDDMTLLVIRI